MSETTNTELNLKEATVEIVAAFVSHNPLPASELPVVISNVHAALVQLGSPVSEGDGGTKASKEPLVPAVPIKKSVTDDYIVSLENGQKFKSLKRHLMTSYGMTPDQYRQKWDLPKDYPMVAPAYAKARSHLAKQLGLGRVSPARRQAA